MGLEIGLKGSPFGSYAVVLGLLFIPVFVFWSYAALTAALGLRHSLLDHSGPALGHPDRERLRSPLLGSPFIRQDSPVAWWVGMATVYVAALIPLVCDGLLLVDYTFHFDVAGARHLPLGLWFGFWDTQGLKPTSFRGVSSDLHPLLLPPWESWFFLMLLAVSCVVTLSIYRRIFSCAKA
jgi:hypothetical protein